MVKTGFYLLAVISIVVLSGCGGVQTQTETQTVTQNSTLTQTVTRDVPTTVTVTVTSTMTSTVTVTANPIPTDHRYQIIQPVSYQITQQTTTYWYFSWTISIKNLDSQGLEFAITVNFVDKDGAVMESGRGQKLIGAGQTQAIFGQTMVPADKALNVISAIAIVELI
jgi:hypothetical protein